MDDVESRQIVAMRSAFGAVFVVGSTFAPFGTIVGVLRGLSMLATVSSVLLLLGRSPSAHQILAGRMTFALALAIIVLSEVVLPLLE